MAGYRRASTSTRPNPSTIAVRLACPQRIDEAHAGCVCGGGLFGAQSRSRSSCATTTARSTPRLRSPVASMWKEALGVETRMVAVEFKSLLQDIDRGDVEIFLAPAGSGITTTPITFAQYLKSDFGINLRIARYRNPKYDELPRRGCGRRSTLLHAAGFSKAGRTADARGSSADAAVFLREQTPGEAQCLTG